MANIQLAKELYKTSKNKNCTWLGPYCNDSESSPLFYENLETVLGEVTVTKLENNILDIKAPSPWHAALYLDQFVFSRSNMCPSPFVFRGHGHSSWTFAPSIYRNGIDENQCRAIIELLCKIAGRYFPLVGIKHSGKNNIHVATAQHYGIPTCLLDFAFDPSVSVFFASSNNQEGDGYVYFTNLNKLIEKGCKIILPPPFVERLYTQTGFFVEEPLNDLLKLQSQCSVISFPKDGSFNCYRNGKEVDLWKDDTWLRNIIDFCKAHFNELKGINIDQWPDSIKELFFKIKIPIYLKEQELVFVKWAEQFQEILYWCAFFIENENEYIEPNILEFIAKNNPLISEFAAIVYSSIGQGNAKVERFKISKILSDAILNVAQKPICGIN